MSLTELPTYVGPGISVTETDISTPAVPQGSLIPAIIGQGSKTLQRVQFLTKGATNGQDGPLTQNTVIDIVSVVDSNNVVYTKNVDYKLLRNGGNVSVDWSPKASLTGTATLSPLPAGLDGLHFKITVNGTVEEVVFTNPATATDVVNQINQWDAPLAGVASLNASNQLVLTANSIEIEQCNALSPLGFTVGEFASVQKPATGLIYQVTYLSDKLTSEYTPKLFSNMNDLIKYHGSLHPAVQLYTGTATAGGTNTLTDTSLALTVDALVGNYIKITSGAGQGQVRVIISNTATTITVSQNWNSSNPPVSGSVYSITDVNNNTVTLGSQTAFDAGATLVITSQYADDLFDSSNAKLAIDNLALPVSGMNPYALVYMHGLGATESTPIAYLKAHVDTQSAIPNNLFRIAIVGLAQGNTTFTTFTQIATGTKDRRIDLVNISTIGKDFGDGQGVVSLDGSYVAAALAGLICANVDAGEPITGKSLGGVFDVTSFSDPFLRREKDAMGGAGVTVIERVGTDIVVRHAVTTDNATPFTQEIKATRVADFVSNYLKSNMTGALIGKRFVQGTTGADLVTMAKTTATILLNNLKSNPQVIYDVTNLDVVKSTVEPRQINLTGNVFITPDLLWADFRLGFSL